MSKELFIYCDESVERGKYYSDFYGGVCVRAEHLDLVRVALEQKKEDLNFFGEVKWTKVTSNYLEKYQELIDMFFEFVQADKIKVRIMFRHNVNVPQNLTAYDKQHGYFLLYYQFIKHAFGLRFANETNEPLYLRTYFDELPDNKEKCELFQNHIFALQSLAQLSRAGIKIRRRDIIQVDSKKHVLLQCLDIVLGAMAFRLNDGHKAIPEGKRRRGKKTVAKEKLYKHIYQKIKRIYPNFNVGISTGTKGDIVNRWEHPYRHWSFVPRDFRVDERYYK